MTATLSIRINSETKKRLDALAKRTRRSKSFLAAEAIAAYVDSEDWQVAEIQKGIADLEAGNEVGHHHVARWMRTWGKRKEMNAP
jgi:RHH-type rel operon transcriptional repressor/antitoxin RelB